MRPAGWNSASKPSTASTTDEPADVHGRDPLPGVGLGVEALHRVEAAGAVVAPGHVQHAVQHGHPGAAAPTQHVGDGRPRVALLATDAAQAAARSLITSALIEPGGAAVSGGALVYLRVVFFHRCEMRGAVVASHRVQVAIWQGERRVNSQEGKY